MKLKAGQMYVRRDGRITAPMVLDANDTEGYPFNDPEHGHDYTATGKYWSEGVEWEYDLISEYLPSEQVNPPSE